MKKTNNIKTGRVISVKMDKTVVVEVGTIKKHPKYHKRYLTSKKYKAHDEGKHQVGDIVTIQEVRPISRHKSWKIIGKEKEKK